MLLQKLLNLLFVRPGKIGGGEAYIKNLLYGFVKKADKNFNFFLLIPKALCTSWEDYKNNDNFHIVRCALDNTSALKRIFYETFFLNNILKLNKIDILFNPVYSKSVIGKPIVPCVSVIHDLQALHYPKYFSRIKLIWLKYIWRRSIQISTKIVTISNYVKKDIINNFDIDNSKIQVIYNPIIIKENYCNFDKIRKKYNINNKEYYYTVSSMAPHKNLITLIKVIKKLKKKKIFLPQKLVISGVGSNSKYHKKLLEISKDLEISNNIVITGFISGIERDTLYKNAAAFLFPSIFEGFGMPPIEALMRGTPVVTTERTSIPEATKNQAIYVSNPFNVDEWINKIKVAINSNRKIIKFNEYNIEKIANEYLDLFYNIYSGKKIEDKEHRSNV